MLALFPALIALVSVVGILFSPTQITTALEDIVTQLGPASAVETLKGPIENIAGGGSKTGIMLIVGIVAALWAASGYVGAFMRASNIMYEVDEGRAIWKLRPLQMLVTLVMILLLALAAIAIVVSGPVAEAVGSAIGVGDTAVMIWDIAKWPVLLGVVTLMLAILYYTAPNAKLEGFKFISPGALVAVVVWIVASLAFAFYVANFGSYDKTYGSLAGVVVFLVWLYITNIAILFGAQLNAERERSKQFDRGVRAPSASCASASATCRRTSRRRPTAWRAPRGGPLSPGGVPPGAILRFLSCRSGLLADMRDRRRTTVAALAGGVALASAGFAIGSQIDDGSADAAKGSARTASGQAVHFDGRRGGPPARRADVRRPRRQARRLRGEAARGARRPPPDAATRARSSRRRSRSR